MSVAKRGSILCQDPVEWDHPLNLGLVSCWVGLENNSGGLRLWDVAGHNHGALTNGPTWVPGPNGFQATKFDGSDDRADFSLPSLTDFTVWVRFSLTSAPSGNQTVFAWDNYSASPRNHCIIQSNNLGSGQCNFDIGVADTGGSATGGALSANVDYRVAVTRLGTAAQPYLNETAVGSAITVGSGAFTPLNPRISAHNYDSTEHEWCPCVVIELRVYSRALSASEIFALYSQSLQGHPDTFKRRRQVVAKAPVAGGGGTGGKYLPLLGVG